MEELKAIDRTEAGQSLEEIFLELTDE
jgi:hypothetical protein